VCCVREVCVVVVVVVCGVCGVCFVFVLCVVWFVWFVVSNHHPNQGSKSINLGQKRQPLRAKVSTIVVVATQDQEKSRKLRCMNCRTVQYCVLSDWGSTSD
jgi:hypothetical protein